MTTTISGVRILRETGFGEPSDVTFADGTITSVAPSGARPSDGDVIDGAGKFLIPSLFDTHVHFTSEHDLELMATRGVTTAIDLGTYPPSLVDSLRNRPGLTDIRSAGSAASAPGSIQSTVLGFPADSVVASPADAEGFVAKRVSEGVDLIKIIIEDPHRPGSAALSAESIAAIVAAAKSRNLTTVAHATTAFSFQLAVEAGVEIVTHAPVDRPVDDALIDRMLTQGTIVSPTLVMMRRVVAAGAGPARLLLEKVDTAAPVPGPRFDVAVATVSRLYSAGVPIIAGTDANAVGPFSLEHGEALHDELELLTEAGLSSLEVLHSATSGAAAALHLTDRGAIAPGLRADLVLLSADPVADIAASRKIEAVWIAGAPVSGIEA